MIIEPVLNLGIYIRIFLLNMLPGRLKLRNFGLLLLIVLLKSFKILLFFQAGLFQYGKLLRKVI